MTYEEELTRLMAKEIAEVILKPIIVQCIDAAIKHIATEINKDKGRNPPFWANNWRTRK